MATFEIVCDFEFDNIPKMQIPISQSLKPVLLLVSYNIVLNSVIESNIQIKSCLD